MSMSFSVQTDVKPRGSSVNNKPRNDIDAQYQQLERFGGTPHKYYSKTVVYTLGACLAIFGIIIIILSVELGKSNHDKSSIERNSSKSNLDSCPCDPFDTPAFSTAKKQKIRGVNIGGFLVIEPNVSPSLFYQFLGMEKPPIDMRHFCEELGPDEANKQLKGFWKDWVVREDLKLIKESGINTIRVPVGYWMFQSEPDDPYKGCTDGSIEQFNRLLDLADEFDLDVIIDLHAVKESQNGFDNSAWTRDVVWSDDLPGTYIRIVHPHWNDTQDNIDETIEQVGNIAKCYTCHENVVGLSVLNEPFMLDEGLLKDFYTNSFRKVKQIAPHWIVMGGDNFKGDQWEGFWNTEEFEDGLIDVHIYHIFQDDFLIQPLSFHLNLACEHGQDLLDMGTDTLVGEWSLATDDCAMWLLGLNQVARTHVLQDPGFFDLTPPGDCRLVNCANGKDHPSPRPGEDGPTKDGKCPIDAAVSTDAGYLRAYAMRQLFSFEQTKGGWFFWNFKNEMEPRWSWLDAIKQGFIPNVSNLTSLDEFQHACDEEATDAPVKTI